MRSPKNFRPINLLSCVGKTMEKLVNRRLISFLEEEHLLDYRQYAFRKGRGTGMYLGSLGETLAEARAESLHIDIAVLDLAKAYNTVWRDGVLKQLYDWGIRGNLGHFVANFLKDRQFKVAIGGTLSDSFSETNGVPQGSVLSVTLFLVAINSIFGCLPKGVRIFVYADDIVVVVSGPTPGRVRIKLQAAVSAIGRWAEQTGFRISPSKCNISHLCGLFTSPLVDQSL